VVVQPLPDPIAAAEDEVARQRELAADADASEAPATPLLAAGARPEVEEIPADVVYLLTGYRADKDLLCRAGVRLDDRDAPVLDSQTFETNVPGLFVAGGAVAGQDTSTVFIENGRFHGEKIIETIAARLAS
jgi:thioredoxin reductase